MNIQQLKKSMALIILLTSMSSLIFAQNQEAFNLDAMLAFNGKLEHQAAMVIEKKQARAKEVLEENGFKCTRTEGGIFLSTSLMLNGKPLDFAEFNLASSGELTVTNAMITPDQSIPFYVYLKRNGNKVNILNTEIVDQTQNKIDVSEVLQHAQPGDYLVIEAVNTEDRAISILKLLPLGC